jgi:hypothetical protein
MMNSLDLRDTVARGTVRDLFKLTRLEVRP